MQDFTRNKNNQGHHLTLSKQVASYYVSVFTYYYVAEF